MHPICHRPGFVTRILINSRKLSRSGLAHAAAAVSPVSNASPLGREALSRESRSAHRGLLGRSWLTPLWPFSRYQMPPLENAKRFPRCEAALDVGAPRHQDEVDAFI